MGAGRNKSIRAGRIWAAVIVAALATPAAAQLAGDPAFDGLYAVGPPEKLARALAGDAARICAPAVASLPTGVTHYRPPVDEIARGLAVDFCEAAIVDADAIDAVLADADAMDLAVEAVSLTDGQPYTAAALSLLPPPPAPMAESALPPARAIAPAGTMAKPQPAAPKAMPKAMPQPAPQAAPSARAIFRKAYETLAGGDPAAAAVAFAEGLHMQPANHIAHYYLGVAYERMGRPDYAAVQYERIVAFWPQTAEADAAARGLERVGPGGAAAAKAPRETRSIAEVYEAGRSKSGAGRSGGESRTSPVEKVMAAAKPAPKKMMAPAAAAPAMAAKPAMAARPAPAPVAMAPSDPNVVEIAYGDGARYIGAVKQDMPHGDGKMTYADGAVYVGAFRDGLRHGDGQLALQDGLVYEGQFVRDAISGRGKLVWPDGAVYQGDFIKGARTGDGLYVWPSGSRYQGRFDDGVIVGPGVFEAADGERYEGEFEAGRRTGRGVVTYANGERYEGDVVDGAPSGQGVYTWPDGRTRSGKWVRGAPVEQ